MVDVQDVRRIALTFTDVTGDPASATNATLVMAGPQVDSAS